MTLKVWDLAQPEEKKKNRRKKKKNVNESLMRKSACSNFTSNDYFPDLTSPNSFVFGGMCLGGACT